MELMSVFVNNQPKFPDLGPVDTLDMKTEYFDFKNVDFASINLYLGSFQWKNCLIVCRVWILC